jgi:hypothetical protein
MIDSTDFKPLHVSDRAQILQLKDVLHHPEEQFLLQHWGEPAYILFLAQDNLTLMLQLSFAIENIEGMYG